MYKANEESLTTVSLDQSLYDRISQLSVQPEVLESDACRYARDVGAEIENLLRPSPESTELKNLLASTHLQGVLQAHDVIIHEIYEGSARANTLAQRSSVHDTISQTEPQTSTCLATTNTLPFSYVNGGIVPLLNNPPSTSAEDQSPFVPPMFDDDDDLMMDVVSRVRLIQFQKDTEEPMGITLKVTEDGRCLVARIMHGGMIHRQATLHVGDEIREINGVSVSNQSVESLQRMLRDARGAVTFKIVPSFRSAPPACEIFVRAQFDYDPAQDDLIPCPQAGVSFKTGDILQV
ncbi:hypothetical protein AB6A40_008441 [Gnathostoma spinigerum]|uniref:Uncharacterized protein n=1 Tax=Gnathostoma spinigerum TaxID=75299 RepID=A0ABD6ERG3_9BILA